MYFLTTDLYFLQKNAAEMFLSMYQTYKKILICQQVQQHNKI